MLPLRIGEPVLLSDLRRCSILLLASLHDVDLLLFLPSAETPGELTKDVLAVINVEFPQSLDKSYYELRTDFSV